MAPGAPMRSPSKHRSRRLRKKLRAGEFQEWGFRFEADLKVRVPAGEEALVGSFLAEVIEPRSLALGGWITSGFVVPFGRGSATDEDRQAVQDWLQARPELTAARVGPLIDAWHGPW